MTSDDLEHRVRMMHLKLDTMRMWAAKQSIREDWNRHAQTRYGRIAKSLNRAQAEMALVVTELQQEKGQ